MKQFLGLLILLSLVITSCRDDVLVPNVIDKEDNQQIFEEGDVFGIVIDESGELLPGVDITVEGNSTTTDENGYFKISKLTGNDNGSLIKFNANGYFAGYKFVYTANNQDAYVEIRMVSKNESFSFQSQTGGSVNINGGAKIEIPENGIVTSSGDIYTGEVQVSAYWYSPEDVLTLETMPGDLRGIDKDGLSVQLATFGMMAVELETPSGIELQLGNNQKAQLTFPLTSNFSNSAPENIPMWHLNELSGEWEEEGMAKLVDGNYVGEVSHFSFWNCDASFPVVEIEGVLTDESGLPIPNYYVSIKWDGTYFGGYGLTNSSGVFKGKVPQNAPLTLFVQHCGIVLLEENLGLLSTETDLGTFAISLTNFGKQVSAKLLGCTNSPLVDGYAIIRNGYRPQLMVPDPEGNVTAVVAGCGSPQIIFTGHDPYEMNNTDAIIIPVDNNDQDLGDISVCENLDEFVNFTINDGVLNQISTSDVFLIDNKLVHLNAFDPTTNISFNVQVELSEIGTMDANTFDIRGFDENNNLFENACRESMPSCILNVEFTSTPELGMILTGTATGVMPRDSINPSSGELSEIEAGFRVNVDRVFNTGRIEGQAWVDENENGIREAGELPLKNAYVFVRRADFSSNQLYSDEFPSFQTDENGSYFTEGLMPGEDYIVQFNKSGFYMPVDAFQGSDETVDSDFTIDSNGNFYMSQIITLSDGETVSNIDLGVSIPTVEIFAFSADCSPDAQINFNIQGGVSPFTVELSNGEVINDGSTTFDGLMHGEHTLVVTDALGATDEFTIDIPEFRHRIEGYVWQESIDGTPNVIDQFDEKFVNVEVELINGSGIVATLNTDSNGRYAFVDFPPDDYQIRPIVPSGYELVEDSVGEEWQDSDVISTTGLSEIIKAEGCITGTRVDFGFKQN